MADRKSTRLNSSHTDIYTLSLHDALPISALAQHLEVPTEQIATAVVDYCAEAANKLAGLTADGRSEEHTSELQSHRYLHSFPTRRSSDLRTSPTSRGSYRTNCDGRG